MSFPPSHNSVPQNSGDAPLPGRQGSQREIFGALDRANVHSLEILSGILFWGGAGWLLDRWLGSTPWLFAIGVLMGFGGGLYLTWVRTGGKSGVIATADDDGCAP